MPWWALETIDAIEKLREVKTVIAYVGANVDCNSVEDTALTLDHPIEKYVENLAFINTFKIDAVRDMIEREYG